MLFDHDGYERLYADVFCVAVAPYPHHESPFMGTIEKVDIEVGTMPVGLSEKKLLTLPGAGMARAGMASLLLRIRLSCDQSAAVPTTPGNGKGREVE